MKMFKSTIVAVALTMAAGIVSSGATINTADARVNTTALESNFSVANAATSAINFGPSLDNHVKTSPVVDAVQVAWSLGGAYKKAKRGVKAANRAIVPKEIRDGASWGYRNAKKGAKHVYDHPYGRRCKPDKFLRPVCTIKPKR